MMAPLSSSGSLHLPSIHVPALARRACRACGRKQVTLSQRAQVRLDHERRLAVFTSQLAEPAMPNPTTS